MRQKQFIFCLAATLTITACANDCTAQWQPSRNVELISSANSGGGPDITARLIQSIWGRKVPGVPMLVVNKSGGNYAAARAYLGQHGGDGHYLLMASLGLLTGNGADSGSLATDGSVIAQLFSEYMVLAARADSPLKNGRDLAQILVREPAALTIAIGGGVGGINHLAIATALRAAGVDIRKLRLIAFSSSAEAAVAVLGGHVDMVAATATALLHADTGGLRMLAISAPRRLGGAFAGVSTWREQGVDTVFDNFRFVLGANGLRREQIAYWETAFAGLNASEEWQRALAANHWTAAYLNSEQTRQSVISRYQQMQAVLTELGLFKH